MMDKTNFLLDSLKEKALKHSNYGSFKQSLIRDEVIALASEEVKSHGFKGLKEFYKQNRRK